MLFPDLPVVSRCIIPPFKGTFFTVTPIAFKKQFQTFSTAQPAYGFSISCQRCLPDSTYHFIAFYRFFINHLLLTPFSVSVDDTRYAE